MCYEYFYICFNRLPLIKKPGIRYLHEKISIEIFLIDRVITKYVVFDPH